MFVRRLEFHRSRDERLREKYFAQIRRGSDEAPAAIATLHALWPAAFPIRRERIRPLASGIVEKITAATGWSRPYTRGVLTAWKSRADYCEAVLRCERRYDLGGVETGQRVDAAAGGKARKRLALLAARSRAATRAEGDRPAAR
jgi:sRNA-binding protein